MFTLYKWLLYQYCLFVLFIGIVISGSDIESEGLDLELRLAQPISHQTSANTVKHDDMEQQTDKGPNNRKRKHKSQAGEPVSEKIVYI